MDIIKEADKFLYGLFLNAAKGVKDNYHRRQFKGFNRELVSVFAGDWDEAERDEEYRELVLPYWEKFGRKPDRFWFELAGSRDRKMDPRYIPSDLYYLELLPYINNQPFHYALEDKNYLDLRFPDVKQAATVCRRIAGEYYDAEMTLIDKEAAAGLVKEYEGSLFIKPALYTAFGNGIKEFIPAELSDEDIEDLFTSTGANFIVQKKIMQHASLASINPDSVCTIRVLSLFTEGKIYIPNMYLRVSTPGSSHVTPGSEYNTEIRPDGSISQKVCFDEGGWLDNREEGIFEECLVIPGIERVLDEVRRIHPRVSHFKWIGWDYTIDEDGDPVLIELNASPGDHAQRVCGRPLFGDMTDWVLEDYFKNRSMDDNQLNGSWCTNNNINKICG